MTKYPNALFEDPSSDVLAYWFNQLPAPIIVVSNDPPFRVEAINEACEQLLGKNRKEF